MQVPVDVGGERASAEQRGVDALSIGPGGDHRPEAVDMEFLLGGLLASCGTGKLVIGDCGDVGERHDHAVTPVARERAREAADVGEGVGVVEDGARRLIDGAGDLLAQDEEGAGAGALSSGESPPAEESFESSVGIEDEVVHGASLRAFVAAPVEVAESFEVGLEDGVDGGEVSHVVGGVSLVFSGEGAPIPSREGDGLAEDDVAAFLDEVAQ